MASSASPISIYPWPVHKPHLIPATSYHVMHSVHAVYIFHQQPLSSDMTSLHCNIFPLLSTLSNHLNLFLVTPRWLFSSLEEVGVGPVIQARKKNNCYRIENHIDHFCINRKFRRPMQDARAKRGTDLASDHHPLVAKLKLKLQKNEIATSTIRQKYKTGFLKDTHKKEESNIKQQIPNKLTEDGNKLESKSMTIKETIRECTKYPGN